MIVRVNRWRHNHHVARWLALIVWASVAASAAFWGRKLIGPPTQASADLESSRTASLANMSRLFGGPQSAKPSVVTQTSGEQLRFQLIGVIAPSDTTSASNGVALIVVDGQRARAYRVGAMLDSAWAVRAVHMHGVSIGPRNGGSAISLELPPLPRTDTGYVSTAGLNETQAATHVNSSPQMPTAISPPALVRDGARQGRAPNTMLNNPADMAPADTGN